VLGAERQLLATAIAAMLARAPGLLLTPLRVDRSGHPILLDQPQCDVAIVDRAEVAANLKRALPDIRTVMFVRRRDPDTVLASVHAGAAACVDDHISADALIDVLRRVTAGEAVYEPSVLIMCLQQYSARRTVPDRTAKLSQRELEVLSVLARGANSVEAAKHVGVSLNTLRTHIRNVLAKVGARSQLEAVMIALREGRISLDPHDD
jgi:DNA-binding NarL/FixJ family response regulator